MCVVRRVPVLSLENSPCNTLCCPGTWKVQGSPAARRLQGKRCFEVTFGLNGKESANSGTCPAGFSAGFQTFLLTGTDVRKIPGLIEKFSFFPGNKLSFRTRGTNPAKFPFSWKPDTVPAPQPEAPRGSCLPLPEGRSCSLH